LVLLLLLFLLLLKEGSNVFAIMEDDCKCSPPPRCPWSVLQDFRLQAELLESTNGFPQAWCFLIQMHEKIRRNAATMRKHKRR